MDRFQKMVEKDLMDLAQKACSNPGPKQDNLTTEERMALKTLEQDPYHCDKEL